ncbi:frataxin, mitochondrial-like isoform X2 [Phoenix dactylifera]|uniref:ferroxidase n=1 Tax=Phoenix dactylifera TaxID=42345 RepID=A0A8B7D4Z6_PHODC|nr:frataxin, mitochondrial-like isoform X2 [Phoenix dactylifera]
MLCPISSFDIRSFLFSQTLSQRFMAFPFSPRLLLRRLLTTTRSRPPPLLFSSFSASCPRCRSPILEASVAFGLGGRDGGCLSLSRASRLLGSPSVSRVFFSIRTSDIDGPQGPAVVDYRSVLAEDEFHRLADATIHDLQEKFEEYGDSVQIDGYDIDYGNQVLTLKLGSLGTYVINKQTPNRQIWLSSPVSGPARFDWDVEAKSWMYRRTKANLLQLLEEELQQLCGKPINLS